MPRLELLHKSFSIMSNGNPQDVEKIKNELFDHLKDSGDDPQLNDLIRVLDTFLIEAKDNDFEECCEIVKPIFNRLSNTDDWDFYDILILNRVLDYAETYSQTYELSTIVLDKLQEYQNEEDRETIKVWVYLNTMLRMVREKYFKSDDLVTSEELDEHFLDYFNAVMKMADEDAPNFNLHKEVARIRRGLFFHDDQLTNDGFQRLKLIDKDLYKLIENSAKEFNFLTDAGKSKKQLATTIGKAIKEKRKEMKLTALGLAKAIGKTKSFIGQLESGQRVPSVKTLMELCDFLNVTPNYFYLLEKSETDDNDPINIQMTLLNGYAKNLSYKQLQFLVNVARDLPDTKD